MQELVKLHGGRIEAESVCGRGTTFSVTMPFGQAHLPANRIGRPRQTASTAVSLDAYVVEASRWLSADEENSPLIDDLDRPTPPEVAAAVATQPRILVADDNADMRDYVRRLLAGRYEVNAVGDGEAALAVMQTERPDLVITDVMMPRLDGFGLLKALRSDPETRTIPVVMLSARAGEDARIEGIQAGADEYLIKPFSARELVARVSAAIELARVRREVAAANERASAILETITDGFIAVDKDWRFTYMNAEAERMNRMSRGEALGKNHWEVFPDTVGTTVHREFHRAVAEQVAVEFENYYEPWNRWFEVKAYPSKDGGLSAYFRDVTARKQAEERERQLAAETAVATAKFRAVFDQSGVFAVIMTLDGIIIEANRQCLEGCGFRREEVIGRPLWECAWWSASEEVQAKIQAGTVLASQGLPYRQVLPYVWADGTEHVMDFALHPIRDETGRVVFLHPTGVDVTEVNRAQREREKLLEKLRDADRRKDEFLAMLAHELRNPLAAITNAVAFAVRVEHGDHLTWAINIITRQLKHLTRLIDDLLDISRISRGKIELRRDILDVAPSLDAAIETVRRLIEERKHTLHTAFSRGNLWANVDPTRLEQVVENLLTNAAKYSDNGGEIWLSANLEDNEVVIRVRDRGFGIPPERLPEMFELFTQGDRTLARSEGGLGIGLTVVKKLVEMHGGTIMARSEGPGKGSEFTVRLPAANRMAPASTEAKPGAEAVASESRRILVVDDNEDAALSIAMLLECYGHEVLTAFSGVEAIEVARLHQPDAIFLDIGLPGMDGYEVALRLREEGCCENPLMVALSGYGQEEDRRLSKAAGFDHHLVKPVDLDVVIKLLAGSPVQTSAGPNATGKSMSVRAD